MKKYCYLIVLLGVSLVLAYCHPSKKTTSTPAEIHKSTYALNVAPVIMNNCSPCHIPAKGGNKKAYDIDEMLRRIQLNPGDKGFMPFKRPKLNDSTIAVFMQWKADGLLEN
jgi:hypothetical protein